MPANPTVILTQPQLLYMSLELSASTWKLAFTPSLSQQPRIRDVTAGNMEQLKLEISTAKRRFDLPETTPVISCYEAGRDGFWLHRCLVSMGVESMIVDPASIQVNRRRRSAKTDRIDAEKIVNALIHHVAGDKYACSMIRIPELVHEDARHISRELSTLKKERTAHSNRIKGLLITHGIKIEIKREFPEQIKELRGGDGKLLGKRLTLRLLHEFQRQQLVTEQIRSVQREQIALIREAKKEIANNDPDRIRSMAAIAEHLTCLKGIGATSGFRLSSEIFAWRDIGNRRQLAAFVGLVPTRHSSGDEEKEQGISKSGRSELRVLMIELAWLWLQHQPGSKLSKWYTERFANGVSRQRKIGIVALARKLLVALGKYVKDGEIPEGAEFSKQLSLGYEASLTPRTKKTQSNATAC